MNEDITIESHPLEPFLPDGARILMLGSFPPKRERWSMDFFYPNFINDMWRIMGLIFFSDKAHFILPGGKRFDRDAVVEFCTEKGIALYDTASQVRRLKDNASDKFLEVVTPTDIRALLERIPDCRAIVTTGQKATDILTATFGCNDPGTGGHVDFTYTAEDGLQRPLRFYRMPSSSRAYPLPLEKKAAVYLQMFTSEHLL
jgi:hypothetical protein